MRSTYCLCVCVTSFTFSNSWKRNSEARWDGRNMRHDAWKSELWLSPAYNFGGNAEETSPPTVPLSLAYSSIARQRLGIWDSAATNIHATIEKFLDASFSMPSVSYQRQVDD
jgi:hypothetical protein